MILWWTAGLAAAALISIRIVASWARKQNSDAPSIPKVRGKLPGNIDILWQLVYNDSREYCGETLRVWAEIYGPTYDMNILWGHQIITADPANVKHILANNFESFAKGAKFREMFDTFLGRGIFTTDGDTWKYHRSMARPFFTTERVSDFDCFERHSSEALRIMSEHADRNQPLDVQHLFSSFTLDVGTDFLFGYSPRNLGDLGISTPSCHSYDSFSEAFNFMNRLVTKRVRIGSNWRFFEVGRDPARKPMKDIHAFIEPIIQNALFRLDTDVDLEEHTFLDHLVKSNSDIPMVRDELLNLLLAARDTTTSLLTFVTYALACHPDIYQHLVNEIEQTMGGRDTPTISDIRSMKYLRAVINEVLRLFPPVPFNIRRCVSSSVLPSPLSKSAPFSVTPGVSITYSPLLIQRRIDVWGQSASIFDPQRWLREGPKIHVSDPFAFLPFNGGPRMCLGQQFAYNECSYFVIRMLRTFKSLHLAPDVQPPESLPPITWTNSHCDRQSIENCWPRASLTLYSEGGLWIRANV
ncbi:cytochrome P450 [Gautieria morchelliformis]|nr:cytochrome P450 [Gautieria morchelliformis]